MRLLESRQAQREGTDLVVARGLGWTSIGIGVTEILAPRQVEKVLGIGNGQHTRVLRAMGVREIAQGIDILAHEDPTPGMWARVAGDMLDNALLAVAARRSRNLSGFAAVSLMVLAIGAADILCAARLTSVRID